MYSEVRRSDKVDQIISKLFIENMFAWYYTYQTGTRLKNMNFKFILLFEPLLLTLEAKIIEQD